MLAACGGRGTDDTASTSSTVEDETAPTTEPEDGSSIGGAEAAAGLTLPRHFLAQQPVGDEVRLTLVLADGEGARLSEPPAELAVRVGPDGGDLRATTTVARHDTGLAPAQAYFPLRTTFDEPGAWRIMVDVDGTRAETVVNAVEPADLPNWPGVGDRLVAVPTPTRRRSEGVDPVCTADPPCPLHATSLADAIDDGDRPVALLIGTPAFCQTGICGPVLDLLVDEAERRDGALTAIHAEVWTDASMNNYTEAVTMHDLPFEPVLFLATSDGTVVERLELVYDAVELGDAVDDLLAAEARA